MNTLRAIALVAVSIVGIGVSSSVTAQPAAEIVHWWYRGGDAAAVKVLIDEFERRGGKWINSVEADYVGVREQVISRLARGYPPTAMQWNGGLETHQLAELGFLNQVKALGLGHDWPNTIAKPVLDLVQSQQDFVGVPVNVHGENWMWHNPGVLSQLGLALPTTFDELLKMAPAIEAAGITPILVSEQIWQRRIFFNSVLLAVAGADIYTRLYRDLDASILDSKDFHNALNVYSKLVSFARPAKKGNAWNDQARALADGEGAFHFMGDWAKSELLLYNKELNVDFDCSLAPGSEDHYIFLIDVFIFGRVIDPQEIAVQKKLARMLLEPELQRRFNAVKGSVSPRLDTDLATLDKCSKIAAHQIARPDALQPAMSNVGDGEFQSDFETAISTLFDKPAMSAQSRITLFRNAIKRQLTRLSSRTGKPESG